MPPLDIENPGVPAVVRVGKILEHLLSEAASSKQTSAIEPAANPPDFEDLTARIAAALKDDVSPSVKDDNGVPQETDKLRQFAVLETAARDIFDELIASTSIDSPEFLQMWNLLDILSMLSDHGQCDPALMFWLVEELLDSQTIAGCGKVFDYLESRRDRITAKHFKQKQLVILRSCNELLRRLSRAEDTAFCGRVFIFLFQSFPLGDRSSVNLRGEFHVENVTRYEMDGDDEETMMDVDDQAKPSDEPVDTRDATKGVTSTSKDGVEPEALYPLFWSLQESFSQPLKLFEVDHFNKFKTSLDATMKAFCTLTGGEGSTKMSENTRRNLRRRKEEDEGLDEAPEMFNPKYLTSKDLFQLEIGDLSFRRHVLVQALIISDFILSLSAGAKEKLVNMNASNKSVLYNDQLNEENTKWATEMKATISEYLKRGHDGPYFYRMVETVLARDKNWVFWKMASCPPIQREPISDGSFNECRGTVQRMATNKRLRQAPMGAVSMEFLRDDDRKLAMDDFQAAERFQLPELDDLKHKVADDDFEISMATNAQARAAAVAGKASKSWRALRLAGRFKIAAFDKIDDWSTIDPVFEDLDEEGGDGNDEEDAVREEDMPEDRSAVIVCTLPVEGKSALVARLMELHPGVFAPVVRHTTREPQEGDVKGKTFHFVDLQEFNQMRDSDRLIEYGTRDGAEYGTSNKAVDAVYETGKVPIMELDIEAAQFARDMEFPARYLLDSSPTLEAVRDRLMRCGHDEAAMAVMLAQRPPVLDEDTLAEIFDDVISVANVEAATQVLDAYIYHGPPRDAEHLQGDDDVALVDVDACAVANDSQGEPADRDASMVDAQPQGGPYGGGDDSQGGDDEGPTIVVKT